MDIRIGKDCLVVPEHCGILIHKSASESELLVRKEIHSKKLIKKGLLSRLTGISQRFNSRK